jgi:hypothetical protein
MSTSRSPESWVLVVVARIMFFSAASPSVYAPKLKSPAKKTAKIKLTEKLF